MENSSVQYSTGAGLSPALPVLENGNSPLGNRPQIFAEF